MPGGLVSQRSHWNRRSVAFAGGVWISAILQFSLAASRLRRRRCDASISAASEAARPTSVGQLSVQFAVLRCIRSRVSAVSIKMASACAAAERACTISSVSLASCALPEAPSKSRRRSGGGGDRYEEEISSVFN